MDIKDLIDEEERNIRLNGIAKDINDIYELLEKRGKIVYDNIHGTYSLIKQAREINKVLIRSEISSVPKKIVNLDIYGAVYSIKEAIRLNRNNRELLKKATKIETYKENLDNSKEIDENDNDMKKEIMELLGDFGRREEKHNEDKKYTL